MDMSGTGAMPMATTTPPMTVTAIAPLTSTAPLTATATMTPMGGMGMSGVSGAGDALPTQIQTLAGLMHDAMQTMQSMMTGGAPTPEQKAAMQAKLDQLHFMMRDVMAQMQGAMVQTSTTPTAQMAAKASAAASSGGMGDMMSMMDSMMSGMGGMGGGSTAAMPAPTAVIAPASPQGAAAAPTPATLERSAAAGAVTVTVLPLNLGAATGGTLDFQVKLETHTVQLDQDLAAISVLRTPSGSEVGSTAWDAPSGGHHIQGTLSFPATDATGAAVAAPGAGTLTLIFRGLAGVAERTFAWDLTQ
jgi:hypothetical protein